MMQLFIPVDLDHVWTPYVHMKMSSFFRDDWKTIKNGSIMIQVESKKKNQNEFNFKIFYFIPSLSIMGWEPVLGNIGTRFSNLQLHYGYRL